MNTKVKAGQYKGLNSLIIKNKILRAEYLPDYGSKLASVKNLKTGREYLYQSSREKLKKPEWGADFSRYDASGFDEIFPSVDPTFYPSGRYRGQQIPDHGDVWSLTWQYELSFDKSEIQFRTAGPELPYRLKKTVMLDDNKLIIKYQAKNLSEEPFKFIWAAHPLFDCQDEVRILLPAGTDRVVNVDDSNEHLGSWGKIHSYPLTNSQKTGEDIDLSSVPTPDRQTCQKFYLPHRLEEGYCGLEYPESGERLELYFPADRVPYLGIWKSMGGFRGDYNLALEPCTGVYDDLYLADKIGRAAIIPAGGEYTWKLTLQISIPN